MLWSEGEMTISFPLTKNRSKGTLFERMYYDTFLYVLKGRLRRRLMKSTNKEPNRIVPKNIATYCTRFMGLAAGLFGGRS